MAIMDQHHVAAEKTEMTISDEHKEMSEHIVAVRNLLSETPVDVIKLISALESLLVLTRSHFQHEETIMITTHFPGMLLHKRDHDYLLKGLSDFTASLGDGTAPVSPVIADNLQSWLRYHIKKFDDAYLEFKALGRSPEI